MQTSKRVINNVQHGLCIGAIAAICFSASAQAIDRTGYSREYIGQGYSGQNYSGQNYSGQSGAEYEYARVIDVRPIVDQYQVNEPVERCYDERVPVQRYSQHQGKQSRTPEILGAIVGAAVGNQFGGGRGRDVATVAGALLGGSVGRDIKNTNRRSRSGYSDYRGYDVVSRCDVSQSYRSEQRIVAYDVSYEYNGRIHQTQMPYDPGDTIRLKVTVQPG